ncbi:MAG: transcriptional regulator GcvA [Roseivivax sp.]|nr:transcriptional regulator GcvA [Roseivivax sp.]
MNDRLPPLTALRAFEAAARHMSFSRAAEELAVTPAALSFQIKSLEDHLGAPVFRRMNRAVDLTEPGRALVPGVRDGFAALNAAWRAARRMQDTRTLTITAGPAFTAKWLAPRLFTFAGQHPEIEMRFVASLRVMDFARDDVDVAIRYGVPQDDDGHSIPLLEECVLPVMTRELAQRFPLPGTLPQAPLLHDDSVSFLTPRPDWAAWFGAAGVAGVPPTGPRFSQADHAIDAALSGAGILLGRTSLIARLLNEGVLVAPYGIALKLPSIYRLVCAAGTESRPQIVAFREWLFGELDREPDVLTGHTVIPGGGPGGWRGKRPG